MQCEEVFRKLDELEQDYIRFWADVCNLESPTTDKARVDAVGRYFAERAKAFGWTVETHPEAVSGDVVCITMNPQSEEKPIIFSGHIDTVHPVGAFGEPPVRFDEQYIYGPGVKDCKGGDVAAFYAMAALEAVGFRKRPVMLILQTDEENHSVTSGKDTVRYMAEKAKDCLLFLNVEGHDPDKVTVRRKGILKCTFRVTGKAIHASTCVRGVNAIAEAAHKVLEIEKFKDAENVTCNVGVIRGGTVANTVPDVCEFEVDIRYKTNEQMHAMQAEMERIAAETHLEGASCTLTVDAGRVAMEETAKNLEMIEKLNRAYAENGMPELIPSGRAGGSDAADISACGIPTLDSLGVSGSGIHSIREKATLASLKQSAKRLAVAAYCL